MSRNGQLSGRGKDSYSIQAVENALTLLEAFCDEGEKVRISQLSEKLGMNKTSVFRLLATLENRGYVERERGSGKYRLGLSAYEMGQRFLSRMGLLRMARPVMEWLVRQCNEAVYLAVRRQEEVLFLDLVDTSHQVKIIPLVGNRFPLSANAAGRVLLAHAPVAEALGDDGEPFPSGEELRTRQQAFCLESGGLGDGVASLAVPLFETGGELTGALCLVGPDFRLTPERIEREFLPLLKEAGEVVSSKLGYLGHHLGKGYI